ncbi:MAG: hypothetical protein K8T91_08615 [Planctomycetes bacterium]|nr:hypothetical protein [Planctomycetota bacterium]
MAEETGTKGAGTTIGYVDGSDVVLIAGVRDQNGPNSEADDIDMTSQDDVTDMHRVFEPGWADAGEYELDLLYKKTATAALYALFRVAKDWVVTYPDGSTWEWSGYLKSIGNEAPYEEEITGTGTFKISGKPVFTPASDS